VGEASQIKFSTQAEHGKY